MTASKTLFGLCLLAALAPAAAAGADICTKTAKAQKSAARLELKEDLKVALAACANITDPDERADCIDEAREEYKEGKALANAVFKERLALCVLLGGDAYDPEIDPDDFTTEIDNEFLPLPFGATWTYHSMSGEDGDEMEVTFVEVLGEDETREIMGVECVSVSDIVSIEGVPVEETIDWYAQDDEGAVWYFGEISFNYDEDGFVEDIDGSWLAGVDGAKPGKVMLADPAGEIGTTYRQEWWLGEAEDAATVLSVTESPTIGLGTFPGSLLTADFQPLDPGALENKYYAPGIGFILETIPGEDETVELVAYTDVGP